MSLSTPIFYDPQEDQPKSTPIQSSTLIPVSSLPRTFLIDTSGSTGGAILNAQKQMVNELFHRTSTTIVSWNSRAEVVSERQFGSMGGSGGTSPSTLFLNGENIISAIHNSPFIVFSTDGDVDLPEVARFSAQCTDHFHHASLILCVLCTRRYTAPALIDLSVFAPLITFPNVILVHRDCQSDDLRVMAMSNEIRKIWNGQHSSLIDAELDLSSFLTLPKISLYKILNLRVDASRRFVRVRPGYRLLSDGHGFSLDALLKTGADTVPIVFSQSDIWNILVEQMHSIVLLCKNERRLVQLRSWITHQRYLLHQHLTTVKQSLPSEQSTQMDLLRSQIEDLMGWLFQNQNEGDLNVVHTHRVQLQVARLSLNKLIAEHNNQINSNPTVVQINQSLKDTDRFLMSIQLAESSSYRSDDVLRGLGNRAMRANDVAPMDDNLNDKLESIVWEDPDSSVPTPKMECRICCDVEHVCIILRYNPNTESNQYQEALEINGRDYVMNCPLAFGRVNLRFLSSQVYCKHCALYLWEHGRLDTFRSKISAIMPVAPWMFKTNRAFFRQVLANSLGGGRDLPHLFLLYYALLDSADSKEWSNEYKPLLTYTFDQMMDHVRCTDNFTETGRKCTLRNAFHILFGISRVQGMDDFVERIELMRQPIESVFVIARHAIRSGIASIDSLSTKKYWFTTHIHKIFVQRYMRLLMERYCVFIKPNGTVEENMAKHTTIVRQLLDALYDCNGLGVPKHGSGRIVRDVNMNVQTGTVFRHPVLETLISSDYKKIIDDNWRRLWDSIDPDWKKFWFGTTPLQDVVPELVPAVSLTRILFSMVGIEYRPLEDIWNWNMAHSPALLAQCTPSISEEAVVQMLNQSMFRLLPKDMKDVDHTGLHDQLPANVLAPCVSHYGTSVLTCVCGFSFLNLGQTFDSIDQLIDSVKQTRARHFERVYGSEYPSSFSYHVNMYKAVIAVVREKYPWIERTTPEILCSKQDLRSMLIRVLYKLNKNGVNGTKGNIFRSELVSQVACVLVNYIQIWQALPLPTGDREADSRVSKQLKSQEFRDKIKAELKMSTLSLPLSSDVVACARQCATSFLRVDSVNPELCAPLTSEEMMSVLPVMQIKRALVN
jgi:hypothetical protein